MSDELRPLLDGMLDRMGERYAGKASAS